MNPRWSLISLFIVAAAGCSQASENQATTTPDDMVAVARLMATLDRVVSEADLEGLAALVSDDAVYMLPEVPAIVGKRAIERWYRNLFETTSVEIHHEPLEMDAAGEYIIHRGVASGTMTPKSGGAPAEFDDKYLFVIRRTPDGSLQIWRAIFNSNAPTPSD
jgi:ketosteroid isomerase-like protein